MHSSPLDSFKRRLALDEIHGLGYFQSVQWVPTVGSTNRSLVQSIRLQELQLPSLLVTDVQTAGMGRGSNAWWSPSGCLMFSMAVPVSHCSPSLDPNQEAGTTLSALLPLRVGFTIAECLGSLASKKPLIKWPNDVYIASKKVCGVLIEVVPGCASSNSVAVIGVGINCQVDVSSGPDDVQMNATSLHEWALPGRLESTSRENVLVQFVHQWLFDEKRQQQDPNWLVSCWPDRSMLDGQWVEVKHASGICRGRCLGILPTGALRIQNEKLEIIEVLAGTVQSYRPLAI
jgi:BirA family biotin operon repressor/biotin-[acetyl-CoA-carboxylase] ligase